MEQQQNIMAEYCEKLIGTKLTVLTEGWDRLAECWFGRSAADAPEVDGRVFFTAEGKTPVIGEFAEVEVTDYMGIDPIGVMV